MKKVILIIAMLIVLSSFALAEPTEMCYQETANDSSITATNPVIIEGSCDQKYNGSYFWTAGWAVNDGSNVRDGDWVTDGSPGLAGGSEAYQVNYTVPNSAKNNSLWKVKTTCEFLNLSIPSGCWNQNSLEFMINTTNTKAFSHCRNTTNDWNLMHTFSSCTFISEEAMIWNVSLGIDNCTIYNTTTLNVTLLNETDDTPINGTMEFIFDYTINSILTNYSTKVIGNNATFCISKGSTAVSDFFVNYVVDGTTYEYFAENLTFNNVSQDIILYAQDGTSQVTFTVTDLFDDPLVGTLIQVLKHDIATNTFKTVEILETNTDGEAVGNLVLFTTWYKFIIINNGAVELLTEPTKIFTTTKVFRIDLTGGDWFGDFDTKIGVTTELNFTNATKNFRYTWIDGSGAMHQGCLQVVKVNRTTELPLYNNCTTSTSATMLFNIGTNFVGNTYIATGFLKFDNEIMTDIFRVSFLNNSVFDPLWNKGENEKEFGVFMSFMLILSLTMIGIWSPTTAIVMTLLGFYITSVLGFINLGFQGFITMAILGIIILYKLGRR